MESRTEFIRLVKAEIKGEYKWCGAPSKDQIDVDDEIIVYLENGRKAYGRACCDGFLCDAKGAEYILISDPLRIIGVVEEREVMFT